jgi:hypothetical protein
VDSALGEAEIRALSMALDDEYRALATYDQVLRDFGPVRPFVNIREAEARHAAALINLFERYGLAVPPNPWLGKAPRYRTVREACEAGVRGEIDNAELYERLKTATVRPDILAVFGLLEDASREHHLPAFRRCAERAGLSSGRGRGRP